MHKTDLVDSIGKREKKRKHKHYMKLEDNKYLRIGLEWKKQPFTGRPTHNGMFIDNFKVWEIEDIAEHSNWGAILAKARQHIKDNVEDYYNTGRKIIVSGRVKKTGEWIDIVEFDTIKNYWKYV